MLLPISAHREHIVETIRQNQVTIVVGETGSGKTTQLPQYLFEACYSSKGVIGITEPRRIAATSVAQFVAQELNTQLGDVVGYQIRFDDKTADGTKIKFMTDGILLEEMKHDPLLKRYAVIMVDEAHERSQNIDFLMGLLKHLLKQRPDLKVVISSATIDAQKFARYFNDAPIIEVSGRTYPVEIVYSSQEYYTSQQLIDATINKVADIHRSQTPGDMLVFMTGVDEINTVINGLQKVITNAVLLPAHGNLSLEELQRIFQRYGQRKIVVATNIAETSITVDGVVYIVDSGQVKMTHFHSGTGIQSLDVVEHSQAGCNQRAGRAGRTQAGVCYRLFTKENFENRPRFTEPEIKRSCLASVVLAMEMIGIADIQHFDFIDPPDAAAFFEAFATLRSLNAIHPKGGLTDLGKRMAQLPLEPRIARMVLAAERDGCVKEVATIAAFLSVRSVMVRPKGKEFEADICHAIFKNDRSDVLTFLHIWKAYQNANYSEGWAREHFLHANTLREVQSIRKQLFALLGRQMELSSTTDTEVILKSVTAGLIHNLLHHASRHAYRGFVREMGTVAIHPSSALFGFFTPRWLVCAEIIATSKAFARCVTEVEAAWLPELLPGHFCFGPIQLFSYDAESNKVVGKREIFLGSKYTNASVLEAIGAVSVQLSLQDAWHLQAEQVSQAAAAGLTLLTFTMKSSLRTFLPKLVATHNGREYQCAGHTAKDGESWYCHLEKNFFGDGYDAKPIVKVLDLPYQQDRPTEKEKEEQVIIPADEAAEMLRKAWGLK